MIRLTQLRIDAHLTPEQLAEKTGVSWQTIYNIENGTSKRPRIGTLHKLAAAFEGASASSLLLPAVPPERDAA